MVPRETFKKFMVARATGDYNMIMDADTLCEIYNIPKVSYMEIINSFSSLRALYPEVEREAEEIAKEQLKLQ